MHLTIFLRYLSKILELFTSKITSFPTFVWKAHPILSTNKYDIFITINRHCPKIEMVIGVRWPLDAYFIVPTCSLFAATKCKSCSYILKHISKTSVAYDVIMRQHNGIKLTSVFLSTKRRLKRASKRPPSFFLMIFQKVDLRVAAMLIS